MDALTNVNVIVTVSPSVFGGEAKNQDRAAFDDSTQTACVCDGITSSPHAGRAAKIITKAASLILDDPSTNLEMATNYLLDRRIAALASPVKINASVSAPIRSLVQEAAKESLKKSFQTTFVALRCEIQQSDVEATMLSCGDSGIFAFSPSGQLLFTNLSGGQRPPAEQHKPSCKTLRFCPGQELLTKSLGTLSHFPIIAQSLQIRTPDNWFLCRAIRLFDSSAPSPVSQGRLALNLYPDELLAVPKYLVTHVKGAQCHTLGWLNYSRFVRRIFTPVEDYSHLTFDLRGHTTAALPDAYKAGQCFNISERFPEDTHFLLCSDGFYRVFSTPAEMWAWLTDHQSALTIRKQKKQLLADLHDRLNQACGDDDISFVWMRPPYGKWGPHAF